MYEVTACALSILLEESYDSSSRDDLSFETWIEESARMYPPFKFWLTILNLIILLLSFVRSVREGDFELYKNSMHLMCPWYFALNHQNYARWLPIHVKDMQELQEKAPGVYREFCAGMNTFEMRFGSRCVCDFINI